MPLSPCTDVCHIEEVSGLCLGCLRTLDEIASWAQASEAEQIAILAAVARRREENDLRSRNQRCDCNR